MKPASWLDLFTWRSLAPHGRWRLFGKTFHRVFFQQAHSFLDCPFELWIPAGDDVLGPVFDVDIGSNAFILDGPSTVTREEAAARRDHRAAVDECRCVGGMDQAAPRAFANQRSNLPALEHVRHQIAARAGHFVNDHHLRSPDTGRRTRERITLAGDVVEVTVEITLEHLDNVVSRGAAAVKALVDDHAFFVLLRKVVTIETVVTRLAGVREINVGYLTI